MGRIATGLVRFSYVNIIEARGFNGSEPKFSLVAIINKDDSVTLNRIESEIRKVYENDTKNFIKNGTKLNINTLSSFIHDGDETGNEAYANKFYINLSNRFQPEVVDEDGNEISVEQVYSGCYGRVSMNIYSYNKMGKRGFGASLGNIQKIYDGDRLDKRISAKSEFCN